MRKAEEGKKAAEKVSVSQALKHFVRDWSEEGSGERRDAFPCLLKTLDGLFPGRKDAEKPVKVLFPGAGLSRLGHEVAALGGKSESLAGLSLIRRHGVFGLGDILTPLCIQASKSRTTSGPCT